jgi:hypothetical protein
MRSEDETSEQFLGVTQLCQAHNVISWVRNQTMPLVAPHSQSRQPRPHRPPWTADPQPLLARLPRDALWHCSIESIHCKAYSRPPHFHPPPSRQYSPAVFCPHQHVHATLASNAPIHVLPPPSPPEGKEPLKLLQPTHSNGQRPRLC